MICKLDRDLADSLDACDIDRKCRSDIVNAIVRTFVNRYLDRLRQFRKNNRSLLGNTYLLDMRTIKWSYDMLRTLREMYPHDTNTRIAATIGVGTRCVVAKAAELGLEKERDIRRKEAEKILMENYGTHSQTEL